MKYFKKKNVKFSPDSCDVVFGENHFKGNLESYSIKINPDDFDGIGFDLKLVSKLKPYRPQDGIIKAGDDYFEFVKDVATDHMSSVVTEEMYCVAPEELWQSKTTSLLLPQQTVLLS